MKSGIGFWQVGWNLCHFSVIVLQCNTFFYLCTYPELGSGKDPHATVTQTSSDNQDVWLDALFDSSHDKQHTADVQSDAQPGRGVASDSSKHSMENDVGIYRRGPSKSAEPAVGLAEGDAVQVMEGPWRGFSGYVSRVAGRQRVALQLDVFGKQTEAEVDIAHCRASD